MFTQRLKMNAEFEIDELPILAKGDVVVIGAGPAGSSAAAAAAAGGAAVLMLEKKEQIGIPVQCAEYVPLSLVAEVPVPTDCIAQRVEGFITYINREQVAQTRAPGYILNRDVFDRYLAERAVKSGVKLFTKAQAVAVTDQGVIVNEQGNLSMVKARIVIGADGPKSVVAQAMPCPPQVLAYAKQITVKLRKRSPWAQIYFSPSIPGGYAWLFPKNDLANVGVSIDLSLGGNVARALAEFQQYLIKEGVISKEVMRTTGGAIPIGGPRLRMQQKNLMLVGDAAGHTHPISGEGIFPAIVAGKIAGSLAVDSIRTGDLIVLAQYPRQYLTRFGEFIERGIKRKVEYNINWEKTDFPVLVRKTWFAFSEYFKS
ncbi:geranylgeranyl reductase family protein [Desulfosporosinus sp. BG]|uniref:geranylgeranyl reductase family protein n=1 Tax=Desulfosporosinus sp. BG TaxID=1633135 RepID=UPI00083A1BCB|nr:geranylgeranyl reductase family protein [Desulfosporosinus sp. BG]ODA40831.1 Digeranylgeranylglycerophospholipid reductase [Desulfosporosinus sp. BG]